MRRWGYFYIYSAFSPCAPGGIHCARDISVFLCPATIPYQIWWLFPKLGVGPHGNRSQCSCERLQFEEQGNPIWCETRLGVACGSSEAVLSSMPWPLARDVTWVPVISPLTPGLCHDLAGGVRMVVDNLGLVLCVVHSSYVTALTESKVAWQVTVAVKGGAPASLASGSLMACIFHVA